VIGTWDANSASWSSYPGFGNTSYSVYRNGVLLGTPAGNYPNNVSWNFGNVANGVTILVEIEANFSGGLVSDVLSASLRCSSGSIIATIN
jgi:hypothetical protein